MANDLAATFPAMDAQYAQLSQRLTSAERRVIGRLDSAARIQALLDEIPDVVSTGSAGCGTTGASTRSVIH